ncbi:hypothetical protein [Paenibacillus eucommiae]|uniref:Uncharacterized protein with FMN-binding domain n=1 Tax=Paenibacillus eucommiae TaxID=1355755 RepID=A0ABS4JAE1_9BACL|nr:hypothetical protein [Paenibacillus eucommiae]MBP1995714.1 uncharacterized protein with FMN-binding domain [Paenibacillus eucommiae]
MRKTMVSIGLVSALSLAIVGMVTVFPYVYAGASEVNRSQHGGMETSAPCVKRDPARSQAKQAAVPPASAGKSVSTINSSSSEKSPFSVVISGGFDTDPQDKGRPVVLIAAALEVPTEIFREAFRGVTPAGLERGPTAEEAQTNKAALLKVLVPYGVTNERLDEVSNYYRYNGSKGEVWSSTQATATATVTNGVVTGVTITNPGAGYTSNPTVTITGPGGKITATAVLSYSNDFKTNGSISAIKIFES